MKLTPAPRLMQLGLLAAAPLLIGQCQPGCGPITSPGPASTTTTGPPATDPSSTASSTTTTTTPPTTVTAPTTVARRPPLAASRSVTVGRQIDGNMLADDDRGNPSGTLTEVRVRFGPTPVLELNEWNPLYDADAIRHAPDPWCGWILILPNGDYAFDAAPTAGAVSCSMEYTVTNSEGSSIGTETLVLDEDLRIPPPRPG